MGLYTVYFENCDVMKIPEEDVTAFHAMGVSDNISLDYSSYKSANDIMLVLKKSFTDKEFQSIMGDDEISNEERLSYGDIVSIRTPKGQEVYVPWEDDSSEQFNSNQSVSYVDEFLNEDENGNWFSITFKTLPSADDLGTKIEQDPNIYVSSDQLGSHTLISLLESFDTRIKALEDAGKPDEFGQDTVDKIKDKLQSVKILLDSISKEVKNE